MIERFIFDSLRTVGGLDGKLLLLVNAHSTVPGKRADDARRISPGSRDCKYRCMPGTMHGAVLPRRDFRLTNDSSSADIDIAYGCGLRTASASASSLASDQPPIMTARSDVTTVACPDCDMLQGIPSLVPGGKASCARCGSLLAKKPYGSRDLPLALALAAAITFVIANAIPLMDLSAVGRTSSSTIAGGAYVMWMQGEQITGILVAFCAVIAPGGYLLFMLTILLAARRSPAPRWVGEMLRWASHLEAWSMLEVMMLGILVALIKIAELATVEAGIGMYAVGVLMLLFPALMVSFDARDLWQRVPWADADIATPLPAGVQAAAPPQ
jgi:paraquat-inducible protein A